MGSVMGNMKCPNCSYKEAHSDYYYKTGELSLFCDRCGLSFNKHESELNQKFIDKNKSKFIGAWAIYSDGGGSLGKRSAKDKSAKTLIADMKKAMKKDATIKECWFSFKKNNRWYINDLIADRIMPWNKWKAFKQALQELEK